MPPSNTQNTGKKSPQNKFFFLKKDPSNTEIYPKNTTTQQAPKYKENNKQIGNEKKKNAERVARGATRAQAKLQLLGWNSLQTLQQV